MHIRLQATKTLVQLRPLASASVARQCDRKIPYGLSLGLRPNESGLNTRSTIPYFYQAINHPFICLNKTGTREFSYFLMPEGIIRR